MKYEIHIGSVVNLDTMREEPKQKIIITAEQLLALDWFADIEMDADLKKTYILNKCRFTVYPHFEFKEK